MLVLASPDEAQAIAAALPPGVFELHLISRPDEAPAACDMASFHVLLAVQEGPGASHLAQLRDQMRDGGTRLLVLLRSCDVLDRVAALELGADVCLPLQVHPLELLAQLRALCRDRPPVAARPPVEGWRFDPGGSRLTGPQGERLRLRPSEAALLQVFLQHPDLPLSRDRLGEALHGRTDAVSGRSIDARVSRLRARLAAHLPAQDLIETYRGGGYRFNSRIGPPLVSEAP